MIYLTLHFVFPFEVMEPSGGAWWEAGKAPVGQRAGQERLLIHGTG